MPAAATATPPVIVAPPVVTMPFPEYSMPFDACCDVDRFVIAQQTVAARKGIMCKGGAHGVTCSSTVDPDSRVITSALKAPFDSRPVIKFVFSAAVSVAERRFPLTAVVEMDSEPDAITKLPFSIVPVGVRRPLFTTPVVACRPLLMVAQPFDTICTKHAVVTAHPQDGTFTGRLANECKMIPSDERWQR